MFQKTDFWIGLAVGAVAGIFGYRFMQEREAQLAAMQQVEPAAELPMAELQRQKEALEDLIAAQEAKKAK
ncbi:MAG: 50S ribosomal protein L9 [Selenomonas sp.]|nr:50S ribosomal protein L9 [Selenomonas sp.]